MNKSNLKKFKKKFNFEFEFERLEYISNNSILATVKYNYLSSNV